MAYNMLTFELFTEDIEPDLLIYLRGSFETALKRIKKRGRGYEQEESKIEYFKLLHSQYDSWIYKQTHFREMLVIDADKYDILKNEDKREVLDLIDQKIKKLKNRYY
jgi:deoxyadenosine/deoxycytidine kinase